LLCELERLTRAGKVGTSHHEFRAANFMGSFYDAFQIIWMLLRTMVAATKNGVGQIDANLKKK
jgi:hypothetical protein